MQRPPFDLFILFFLVKKFLKPRNGITKGDQKELTVHLPYQA